MEERPISNERRNEEEWPAPSPKLFRDFAKNRQRREMGTLGSGNHYLEVQKVVSIFDEPSASAFGIRPKDIVVSIHCGSRGLGHQIGTEFLRDMAAAGCRIWNRAAGSRIGVRSDSISDWGEVFGRDASRDQLRAGESPDHHRTCPAGVREGGSASGPHGSLRCFTQHMQGGGTQDRWTQQGGLHSSKGRDTRFWSGPSGHSRGSSRDRTTGFDRRHDGHRLVHLSRHSRKRAVLFQFFLPRRRPSNEPPSSHQAVARPATGRRACRSGYPDSLAFYTRCSRGGSRSL